MEESAAYRWQVSVTVFVHPIQNELTYNGPRRIFGTIQRSKMDEVTLPPISSTTR
jgi:hypothetical protein